MIKEKELLDKIHAQKYIYLISLFVSKQIEAPVLEKQFLSLRREDEYWLSGLFDETIAELLNSFFLDIDEYTPDDLIDTNDSLCIDENELRNRAVIALNKLKD